MTKSTAIPAVIVLLIACTCASRLTPQTAKQNTPQPLAFDVTAAESFPLSSPRIVVKKAERKLYLYSDGKLVRTYRVGLGLSPVGNKVRQGDRRTPEGEFYLLTRIDKRVSFFSL